MIDEDVLRYLMAEAGNAAPAPGQAPDALLDALAAEPTARARRVLVWRPPVPLAAAAVAAVVVLAGSLVTGGSGADDQAGRAAGEISAGRFPGGDQSSSPRPSTTSTLGALGSVAISGGAVPESAGDFAMPKSAGSDGAVATSPNGSAKVIKTGSIDLEVRKGAFEATIERITALTVGMGGYVAESTTSESDAIPRGGITVRVPAVSFDQLVTELRRLGDVNTVASKGTDVTAQFTDLAARLSALSATRDRLYEVLRGAANVGDIIAVQDRITAVQTEMEQIQGQQRLLTDQTSFGTLAVTLAEPGAKEVRAGERGDGIGAAWREARRRFGNAIEGLVEWSGTASVVALVMLLVGALAWLAWDRGRRRLV